MARAAKKVYPGAVDVRVEMGRAEDMILLILSLLRSFQAQMPTQPDKIIAFILFLRLVFIFYLIM